MDSEGAASTLLHPYCPRYHLQSHSQLCCYVGDWREAHDNSRDKGQQHRNQYHRLTSFHFKVLWIKAAAKWGSIMWMEKWLLFLRRWLIARLKQWWSLESCEIATLSCLLMLILPHRFLCMCNVLHLRTTQKHHRHNMRHTSSFLLLVSRSPPASLS